MKRFRKLFVLLLSALLCFSSSFSSLAASSSTVSDFRITPDDLTGHKDGYDSMCLYYYSSTFYTCFFNDSDVDVSTYDDSKSSYFSLTFENPVPHQTYVGSVEGFMYGRYAGLADCSGLVVKQLSGSSGNKMLFKKSSVFFTDSPTLRAFLIEKGYSCPDEWFLYFDGVNNFDYMCYSLVSTESGEYVVSFAKTDSNFRLTDGVLSCSAGYLYSCIFDTLEAAENYLRTGDPSGMVSCTCPKTLSTVDTVYYASFDVRDSSGNLVFAEYPLPDLSDSEDETHGLLSGIIGAINNLGNNIAIFFNKVIDLLTYPADFVKNSVSDFLQNFKFVENIHTFGTLFLDFLSSDFDECPRFEVHLNNAVSKYDYGDNAVYLDLSYYTKPFSNGICLKDISDPIISGFLWITFLWNLFSGLPNLISGGSMQVFHSDVYDADAAYRRDVYKDRKEKFYKNRRK